MEIYFSSFYRNHLSLPSPEIEISSDSAALARYSCGILFYALFFAEDCTIYAADPWHIPVYSRLFLDTICIAIGWKNLIKLKKKTA